MLEFQKLERSVKTASVWQVRQPVYRSSTERWKRYGEALAPLEAVLKGERPADPEPLKQPAIPPGLFTAAMAQLQAGRAPQAEAMLRQLLAERPEHAAAHHFLGAAFAKQGQLQEAREAMRRSLALYPLQPSWLGNLAAIEEALGERGAAEQLRRQQQRLLDGLPPWELQDSATTDATTASPA